MNWISIPAGLTLAAIVIPPLVLLYFLKLRRRPQVIASTLLWQKSVEDLRANAPFQRLRRNILLLLQLIALILLALAIMQPQVEAGQRNTGKTIILMDVSASMSATDLKQDKRRFDEATRRVRDRIETLYGRALFSSAGGETMIIAFSDRAEVACRFTDSRQQLLAAIDRLRPTHGRSRVGEALRLARAYTTNVDPDTDRPIGDPATLELFSDGRIDDLAEQVLRGERLIYHKIGGDEPDNLAITAISIERPYDRPDAVEVFASMCNFNREPVTADVQLSINGVTRAVEEVLIEAAAENESTGMLTPGRNNVVFVPFEQPQAAVIEVAVVREDDLALDNAARLVVPPPKRLQIALVEASSFLLRMALGGIGSIERITTLTAAQFEKRAAEGGLDRFDVIILDDYAPPMDQLPPGHYLTFGAPPPIEGLIVFGKTEGQLILDHRMEHPIFRFVSFDDLFISAATLIQPGEEIQVLAEGSAGPVILLVVRGPLQALVIPFDPLDSNWPILRSFPTFMLNAVEYLGQVGRAISEGGFAPGDALTARLPAAAASIELQLPDTTTESLEPLDPALVSWGPIVETGIYAVSWMMPDQTERESKLIAVNLLSESESDLAPAGTILTSEQGVEAGKLAGSQFLSLWPWAIGLTLLVVTLEWWIYHRKAYV